MRRIGWWLHYRWDAVSRRLAWLLPRRVAMWAYYRVISDEPDPDAGTREHKPVDVVDTWARFHGLY